jgi:hypothetical protein
MTTSTAAQKFTAKILKVTAKDLDVVGDPSAPKPYTFNVYEFQNGLIMVKGESTNDWFFSSREEIEPNGMAEVLSVEETGETSIFPIDSLIKSMRGSIREFGCEIPAEFLALVPDFVAEEE